MQTARYYRRPHARSSTGGAFFDPALDEVDHRPLDGDLVERVDLLDAGRARDVDFGEEAADDIGADEVEAAPAEIGSESETELARARRKRAQRRARAGREARTRVPRLPDTQHRAGRIGS